MYINLKERMNKRQIRVYYIYVCESKRVEGKVKSTQRYFGNIHEVDIREHNFSILLEAMRIGKFTTKEIWLVEDKLVKKATELQEENT